MAEIINCQSCGASNELPQGKSSMFCAYCGGKVEKVNSDFKEEKPKKSKLKKSKLVDDNKLEYINRDISSLQEIIDLYSDGELQEIVRLILPNNNITSTKGLSRFSEAEKIDLSNNDLQRIDELPCYSDYYKQMYFVDLNFSGNKNLIDFKDEAIKNFNNSTKIATININLEDAVKFNLESLGKFKFKELINSEKGIGVFIIPPNEDSKIPQSLLDIGFKPTDRLGKVWGLSKIKKQPQQQKVNKKEGCFIATATMGSYDHPEVLELRNFRDNWILQKSWGDKFVNRYYKYGSYVAEFIKESYFLKKLSYIIIVKPLVYISRKLK